MKADISSEGGSQAVTFGSAASGLCGLLQSIPILCKLIAGLLTANADFSAIVKDSLKLGKPILAVFVQYRLNIFGFGDETSEGNLGLRDQALALDWVRRNISGFGGDPVSYVGHHLLLHGY
jgi:hypothetical protein